MISEPVQSSEGSELTVALAHWVKLAPVLPVPGDGRTNERFDRLAEVAGADLALGRLAEGHADALAILDEAGLEAAQDATYGVWAARSSAGDLAATRRGKGWTLSGQKGFCSGVGLIDRAVVTADSPEGPRLFDVDLRQTGIEPVAGSWPAIGMAASASVTTTWNSVELEAGQTVGNPGFYTSRIGFWWGAAGVAACWFGGARALVETLVATLSADRLGDHEAAALGTAVARGRSMAETLRWAAQRIDGDAVDLDGARQVALITREAVHDGAMAILTGAAAAGGARPICLDARQSRRSADLYAYLAQHHVGRDAAALGRLILDGRHQDRQALDLGELDGWAASRHP